MKTYSVEQALQAQQALRNAAGLPPERFPVQAFVGMVSDEMEALRTDAEIAELIAKNSTIELSADEIRQHYAPPQARHRGE